MSRDEKGPSPDRPQGFGHVPNIAASVGAPDETAAPLGGAPRPEPSGRGEPPPTVSAGPGAPPPPPPPTARGGERPGDHIGPYKLLEVIGEGGFGVVWLAERRQPITQRVALKIIKPGMDTHAVIARFEQERQALAVMDHPGVARVLDAGATPAGRPFFVMEYVKGEPITTFCDRLRYSIRQRLELLAEVCEAVQHAHHKGLIHRDLKPSNVLVSLVDDRPVPKVIDFGVAKAISHTLTDKTIFTETGQLIGTPEYMSPEQAEMGRTDIDTRTDVYSLGVMLYELLAGALPFDPRELRSRGYEAMCRIIREVEPPAPSARLSRGAAPPSPRVSPGAPRVSPPLSGERRQAGESPADSDRDAPQHVAQRRQTQPAHLAALLRRELEWIPLKAMRKDRARRYATPLNLAQDIRRYLAGEPLEAGPESAAYRVSKWLRRYRGPATAAALVFVALLLGLAGTLWQARRAAERAAAAERAEAEQRRLLQSESAARLDSEAAWNTAVFEAYAANLLTAEASIAANAPGETRARLDACPERLRGWEWGWLNARSDNSVAVLRGHQDSVTCAAFSPDGALIVTGSLDKTARVWDSSSMERVALLVGHENGVTFAAFSPNGARIATASRDMTGRIWDPATGRQVAILMGHKDWVTSATFSPDGARIATASHDGSARIWEAGTGRQLAELVGHKGPVCVAAFSPDGSRVVTSSWDHSARVWDVATGRELIQLRGHNDTVGAAAFTPDGERVVTASFDKTAREWDAATGGELAQVRGDDDATGYAQFSPDGACVAMTFKGGSVRLLNVAASQEIAMLRGHATDTRSASFSADGTFVVTTSEEPTARVWNAATGRQLAMLRGHAASVIAAQFSPDGARIVTASRDCTARVWDATSDADSAQSFGNAGTSVVFTPRVSTVLVEGPRGETAWILDQCSGRNVALLRGRMPAVGCFVELSQDGARALTLSDDRKTACIWDTATGMPVTTLSDVESAFLVQTAFSPDGTRVVTTTGKNCASVWSATTGHQLAMLRGNESTVLEVAFDPDGTRVLTASRDGTARVWNATSGRELARLVGHGDAIRSAEFSPDGRRILTGSLDGTARIWDTATGRGLAVLRGAGPWVGFSRDGTCVRTEQGIWDAVPRRERFREIDEWRRAERTVRTRLSNRLAAGEDLDALGSDLCVDSSLSALELRIGLGIVEAEWRRRDPSRVGRSWRPPWEIVCDRHASSCEVALALEEALDCAACAPRSGIALNTLGIAQYRAGRYDDALQTLTQSDTLNRKRLGSDLGHPADAAFLAMTLHRLGRATEAQATLERLRTLLGEDRWAQDEEAAEFAREAQALIRP